MLSFKMGNNFPTHIVSCVSYLVHINWLVFCVKSKLSFKSSKKCELRQLDSSADLFIHSEVRVDTTVL